MTTVLGQLNLMQTEFNSPSKRQVPIIPADDDMEDSFSFKLAPVSENGKTEVQKPMAKVSNASCVLADFDKFLKD